MNVLSMLLLLLKSGQMHQETFGTRVSMGNNARQNNFSVTVGKLLLKNLSRMSRDVKVKDIVINNDGARDKLIALCINNPGTLEAIAKDPDITANQIILLLSSVPSG